MSCSFCPKTNRKKEFMTLNTFREILEKIKEIYPNEFYLKEQKFTVQKLVLNEPESIMPKSSAKSIQRSCGRNYAN